MAGVRISGATKTFGDFTALHPLDLEIRREGEFLTLLGPSGCGKTTTLRLIAGLIQPTSGIIYLGDDDITGMAPQPRRIGMVFQDCALFPHMTVRQNIAFGLEERRYDKHRIPERADKLLDLIRLPDMGDRYPAEGSASASRWPARSPIRRVSCSWTSPWARSISSFARRCRSRFGETSASSASPRSTSLMTRPRR